MLKKGMTALVTGGSGGIGSAVVKTLAARGVTVIAASNDDDKLKALEGIENVETCLVDVRDFTKLKELFGGREIDAVINAAGVLGVTGTIY